ncbi:MAG TPA: rhomboid family intramembrane serine protease [Candidatus Dormibacteraeota bacterium]|nr:rhomboid family intramembrane serine protease [Candidatus Dormibacteraeota bacterium]
MTESGAADADASAPPPGPPPIALAVGLDLVTRYHLRLTDERDARLGPLAGEYALGAAAWTGRRAAFVGFYQPPPDAAEAERDLQRRYDDAVAWGRERLSVQGADRGDILLVALGPVSRPPAINSGDGAVRVGAVSIDPATTTVNVLAQVPGGLPGATELRNTARALSQGRPPPTLAAVDLAERQTVAGGYAAPTRQAMVATPVVTYSLIGIFAAIYLVERAIEDTLRTRYAPGTLGFARPLFDLGALANSGTFSHDWWRYITSAFLHSDTSIFHVASNCLAMLFIGRLVEQLHGRLVLLGVFLASAVGGGVFWVVCTSIGISSASPFVPGIGASGGIAGLAGLLIMLGRVQGKSVPVGLSGSIRQYVLIIVVLNLFIGFSLQGVNNYAHIGGFATGAALGLILPPVEAVGGRRLRTAEQAAIIALVAAAVLALGFGAQHIADVLSQPQVSTIGGP